MLRDKGVEEFLTASLALRQQREVTCILVGNVDPGNGHSYREAELQEMAAKHGVSWLGYREDIPELLQTADIFCLPSYREGLPMAGLEALATGLPVVTTDVPGCRETVEQKVNGLLVARKDVPGLTAALQTLVDEPETRHRYGSASRRKAEEEFSQEKIIGQYLNLYRDISPGAFG